MTRCIITSLVGVALVAALVIESSARGPRGGGGGGGSRGGGSRGGMGGSRGGMGGSRGGSPSFGGSSAGRSPSMSRTPSRGSGGFSPGGSRSGGSATLGGTRPGSAGSSRPGGSRPSGFPSTGSRPGGSAFERPAGSTRPPSGGGFPSTGSRPGGSAFERPAGSTRPPSGGGFPSTGSRPGGSAFERPAGSTRPPSGGQGRPGNGGPTDQQLGGFLDLPRDRDVGGQTLVVDNRQQQTVSPGPRGPGEDNRVAARRDRVPDRRQEPVENRRERLNNRGDEVRDQARDQRDVFSDQWRGQHQAAVNNRWRYTERHSASFWRRGGTWAGVTGWVAGSWSEPVYYDYGNTIVYEDGDVYQDGAEVASAEQYAQQAQQIAETPVEANPENVEWMPLGTFAMVREKDTQPTMFLELAVSKEGIITGTYFNATSDSAQPVEGHVDTNTQRAAWWIGDNRNNILETGIYNLTQDETPLLVHFGSQQTQTWLLVRLEESTEGTPDNP